MEEIAYLLETEDLFEPGKVEDICSLIGAARVSEDSFNFPHT